MRGEPRKGAIADELEEGRATAGVFEVWSGRRCEITGTDMDGVFEDRRIGIADTDDQQ